MISHMKNLILSLAFFAALLVLPQSVSAEENPGEPAASERSAWRPWTWFRGGNEKAADRASERQEKTVRPESSHRGREIAAEKSKSFSDADRKKIASIPNGELPPGLQKRQEAGRGQPPGLQKRQEKGRGLPSGWADKLDTGKPLPREIEEKAIPVPESLKKHLPEVPEGAADLLIEDHLVRVNEKTREIIDRIKFGSNKRGHP